MIVTFNYCPDCESHHIGDRCHMTFAERLRTVQVDGAALETRTKRDYYDLESVHDTFGEDAEDRMMDATKGIGAIKRGADGKLWRKDRRSGDIVRAEQKLDTLLAADTETSEVDPSLDTD